MSVTGAVAGIVVVVGCMAVVSASAATPAQKAPRIVAALMQDADRDGQADRVALTYSTRIRHLVDRDGRYPLTVAGYRIRFVGAASGRRLALGLVERGQPDTLARPAIRYRRTRLQPVLGPTRIEAAKQLFGKARPHRIAPPAQPAPPPPAPTPGPPPQAAPSDADGDGTLDARDCAPRDAAIRPGAADLPDLGFVDSNCDGIDGNEATSVFASPLGKDTNPGTKGAPKREIQAAVAAAAGTGRYVLAAAGTYSRLTLTRGVGIFGGYDPADWARKSDAITTVSGSPEGVLTDGAKDVTLQLLRVLGSSNGASAYGIRALNGSELRLERVTLAAGSGSAGAAGAPGQRGLPGGNGVKGMVGSCDGKGVARGGAGGESPVGREGGTGGDGYYEVRGGNGATGVVGTPGGKGGGAGSQGGFGEPGEDGSSGAAGVVGAGGTNATMLASGVWRGQGGRDGVYGAPGNGGGGGGASGGQTGAFVVNGTGNAGSGGGGGAAGGRGGESGGAGGGSFGIYLFDSTLVVAASAIQAGNGGQGGRGGSGGAGGKGGDGGPYIVHCGQEIGRGARGGRGGDGGQGGGAGGGAGGPSIGVMKVGASSAILTATAVTVGAGGPGGAPGAGGTGTPASSEAGLRQAIHP